MQISELVRGAGVVLEGGIGRQGVLLMVARERIDYITLQETINSDFTFFYTRSVDRSESELSIFSFFFVGGFACWVGFPARRNAEQKFLGMFD